MAHADLDHAGTCRHMKPDRLMLAHAKHAGHAIRAWLMPCPCTYFMHACGMQVVYEAYGAGGSGFIIDCLTDNANRSAMEVRTVVQRSGGKMADPGSVAFGFRRCGIVAILAGADEDEV